MRNFCVHSEELCVRIEQQFKDEVNVRNFVFEDEVM